MGGNGNCKRLRSDIDPEVTCPKCSMEIRDSSVQCYSCDHWYHGHCVGLTKEQVDSIGKMNSNVEIVCKTCKKNKDKKSVEYEKLKENNEMLTLRNNRLEKDNQELKKSIENFTESLNQLKNDLRSDIMNEVRSEIDKIRQAAGPIAMETSNGLDLKNQIKEILRDDEDQRARRNNLVLYNLKESSEEGAVTRERDDLLKVVDIFKNGVRQPEVLIEKVIRMGKRPEGENADRKRPLLVRLKEGEGNKWTILKNAKNLKNAPEWMRKIGISQDLTKQQREDEKKLRSELMSRRRNGDDTWFIKGGQLCKKN